MTPTTLVDTTAVERYRTDGHLTVRDGVPLQLLESVLAAARPLATPRAAATDMSAYEETFTQVVNAWRLSDDIAALTFLSELGRTAEALAGVPLRLWHDHLLVKPATQGRPTHLHQDQPYWPHSGARAAISCWIPLVDVPVERGCLGFLPGTQELGCLPALDLTDAEALFAVEPSLTHHPRVLVPLAPGDVSFHDSRVVHFAMENRTPTPRWALALAWTDVDTLYDGRPHPVTDGHELATGSRFPDDLFPPVA